MLDGDKYLGLEKNDFKKERKNYYFDGNFDQKYKKKNLPHFNTKSCKITKWNKMRMTLMILVNCCCGIFVEKRKTKQEFVGLINANN